MNNKIKSVLKSLLISLSTLAVGFLSISIPFNLFETLTVKEMRIIFLSEIIIYSVLFASFFLVKEKKEEKAKIKKQEKLKKEKRRLELLKDLEEFNMAA